jgi:hypothetical protein
MQKIIKDESGNIRSDFTVQQIYDRRPNQFCYKGEIYRVKTKTTWESNNHVIWFDGTAMHKKRKDIIN